MTARDELRAMLDERGVKWRKWDYFGIDMGTVFSASGIEWIALWNPETNKLSITNYKIDLTPEQAIAATLGERQHEEIVLCKDCKHYKEHKWILITDVSDVCEFFSDGVKVEPNGFCKWGVRKEPDE